MGLFRSKPSPGAPDAASVPEDPLAAIGPGVPGRCRECGGLGYIDSIDIGHRFQIQHCKECGHRWEYLFDADGVVVGLTELDDTGQPVARMRVRSAPPAPPKLPVDPPPSRRDGDEVIDLRDPEPAPEEPEAEQAAADHLSPAEWLRHSLRR